MHAMRHELKALPRSAFRLSPNKIRRHTDCRYQRLSEFRTRASASAGSPETRPERLPRPLYHHPPSLEPRHHTDCQRLPEFRTDSVSWFAFRRRAHQATIATGHDTAHTGDGLIWLMTLASLLEYRHMHHRVPKSKAPNTEHMRRLYHDDVIIPWPMQLFESRLRAASTCGMTTIILSPHIDRMSFRELWTHHATHSSPDSRARISICLHVGREARKHLLVVASQVSTLTQRAACSSVCLEAARGSSIDTSGLQATSRMLSGARLHVKLKRLRTIIWSRSGQALSPPQSPYRPSQSHLRTVRASDDASTSITG
ncbi:hypothetical protein EVG20_g10036 [Dentipellis fragilis]|uniref:Uncharacterized protein n=1 Tax=Dentipellis fragilis TaxID=205917 RepID=A0A4Y9XW15_9AGAM|nr:hypothetical protein EVG20_g10036 [Dentipellis fragilis]